MKTTGALSLLPLVTMLSIGAKILVAQSPTATGRETVLIVLRQTEGPIGRRLAGIPHGTIVPEEVQAAGRREQASLAKEQQESFDRRIEAAGATGVIHYPGINMVRAEIPSAVMSSLQSDPAVLALTPLSGEAQASPASIPPANLGMGSAPSAGAAIGSRGRRSDTLQSPLLQSGMGQMGGANPAFMASLPPAMPMPGMPMPGMQGGMPGFPPMGQQTGGGMGLSLLGLTGQMGAQMGMAMPRAAGILALVAGGAQIAQIIASNRKPSCSINLDVANVQIPATGGPGSFMVRASPSCLWQAQSNVDWLQIDNDGPMVGPSVVRFTVTASKEAGRTGVITLAGVAKMTMKGKTSFSVTQGPGSVTQGP